MGGAWALPEVIRIGTSLPDWASGRNKFRGAVGIPTGSPHSVPGFVPGGTMNGVKGLDGLR